MSATALAKAVTTSTHTYPLQTVLNPNDTTHKQGVHKTSEQLDKQGVYALTTGNPFSGTNYLDLV